MTETQFSRRSALTAGAWTLPVIAIAAAVPSAAASTSASVTAVTIDGSQPQPAGTPLVNVTFAAEALPLSPGTVLTYRRTSGTGVIQGGSLAPLWTYSWPNGTELDFYPPANPSLTTNEFRITFSGPSEWAIELAFPGGQTYSGVISIAAPV